MDNSKTAYPLSWPLGRKRTPSCQTTRSRFDTSFAQARSNLVQEIDRLGARRPILSTNVELRIDGLPYANRAEPRSEEHTSELQSLMRISYAVFCLKKKTTQQHDKDKH